MRYNVNMNDDGQDDVVYDIDKAHEAIYGHKPGIHEPVDMAREVREAEKSRRGGRKKKSEVEENRG